MLGKEISKVLYHIDQEKSISRRRKQLTVLCVTEQSNKTRAKKY